MEAPTPRSRAIHDLFAAHRELSALEWLEFKNAMIAAALWVVFGGLFCLAGWLCLNAAVVLAFRSEPLKAVGAVALLNGLGAAVAAWRASSLLNKPFFALTKREAAVDARALLKVLS